MFARSVRSQLRGGHTRTHFSGKLAPASVQALSNLTTASNAAKDPTAVAAQRGQFRNLSSFPPSRGTRYFPQYNVPGETCMLQMKIIPPAFRVNRDNLSVDPAKRGRILLEFTPRLPDGTFVWSDNVRFALSAEEVGLICNQLPHYPVELTREMQTQADEQAANTDNPDKVFKVSPGEGGTVSFKVDFVKDGIGGQPPAPGQEGKGGPLEIEIQLGEFEVISSLMKESIPSLIGWSQLVEKAMENSVQEAIDGTGGGRRPPPF